MITHTIWKRTDQINRRGITRDEVEEAVEMPDRVDLGRHGETLAIKTLRPGRVIKVAYKIEREGRIIITAFLT
jgi:hypothetical protein